MKNSRAVNLLLLHIIVFIWGFTGILGKEIELAAFELVWWRVFIATCSLLLFAVISRSNLRANFIDILKFSGVGFITAAHWVCFFSSIKESTISVALVVISTTAFFVSIISPLIRKEKFQSYEIVLGGVVFLGLLVIFKFEGQYVAGIILSLMAALFAAVFSTINSKLIEKHNSLKIAFWEMLAALFGMSVFIFFQGDFDTEMMQPGFTNMWLLLLLGIVCTGFAFVAGIEVMKVLSPFTCALVINLEPIYTIAIALMLYGKSEWMSSEFYIGAMIILTTLFVDVWLKKRSKATALKNPK